jgi:hypothetical protein
MLNRMTPIVTVCLLLACFSPPWIIPPAAAQTIPGGYQLITDPQGTAAMIVAQRPARSATAALAQGIAEVAGAFDAKPTLLGAFRDVRDQTAEAGFRTTLRRVPVSGIAFADVSGGTARVGFAFDSMQAPAAGIMRLLQQAGHIPAGSGGSTGGTPGNWRTEQYPDGSGTVRLPEGWQIVSAVKGAMDAAGPQGRIFKAINIQCTTRAGAAQTEQVLRMAGMPPHLIAQNFARIIIADPGEPASTMVAVGLQNSAKFGDGSYRHLRLVQVVPLQPPPGLAQAAIIDHEYMLKGVRERSLVYVAISGDFGNGTWGYYTSGLATRSETFARNFSLLYEILLSAQTARHTIQERWDSTLNNMREIGEIRRQVHDNRSLSNERIHADRIEALQGRRIVQDRSTGQTGYANLGYSREVVQSLNTQAGWARYQEIPLRDLVR